MRAGFGVMVGVVAAVAGCARGPAADCTRSETLVDQGGEVVVFVNDCDGGFVRPATAADLARLEAPL